MFRFLEPLVQGKIKEKILIKEDDIDVYRASYPGFSHDCEVM